MRATWTRKGYVEVWRDGVRVPGNFSDDTNAYEAVLEHAEQHGPGVYIVRYPDRELKVIGTIADQSADTQAPTTPANLQGVALNAVTVRLTCDPATDNVGVAGYQWFRDGVPLPTTVDPTTDVTVPQGSTSDFQVQAFDAASLSSPISAAIQVTTPSNSAPSWANAPATVYLQPGTAYNVALSSWCEDPEDDTIAFSVASGTLPAGVVLNPSLGTLSGTPTTEATSNVVLRASDGISAPVDSPTIVFVTDGTVPTTPDITSRPTGQTTFDIELDTESTDALSGLKEYVLERALDAAGGSSVTVPGTFVEIARGLNIFTAGVYAATGLTANTTYYWRLTGVDRSGNVSAATQDFDTTFADPPVGGDEPFIVHVDSNELLPVPGAAGYSRSGTGFRPDNGATPKVYLITQNSGNFFSPQGNNIFHSSPNPACDDPDPRVVLDVTSGRKEQIEHSWNGRHKTIFGFTVRPDRISSWKSQAFYSRGGHTMYMGLRVYLHNEGPTGPPGFPGDRRIFGFDPVGGSAGTETDAIVANCQGFFGLDQNLSFYKFFGPCDVIESSMLLGLWDSIHPEGPHGSGMIFLDDSAKNNDQACVLRSFIGFFGLGRGPLSFARRHAYGNNLIYCMSRMSDFGDYTGNPQGFVDNVPRHAVIGKSLYVGGAVGIQGSPVNAQFGLPVGSRLALVGNRAHNNPSAFKTVNDNDQSSFTDFVGGQEYFTEDLSELIAGVIPGPWGADLSGLVDIPTSIVGKLDYVERFRLVSGGGSLNDQCLDFVRNRLNNTAPFHFPGTSQPGLIDDMSEAGGIPDDEVTTVDLTDTGDIAAYFGNNPFPPAAILHDVKPGTGGRTYLEDWCLTIQQLRTRGS